MVHCKIALAGSLRRFSAADGPTDGTDAPALTLPALRRAIAALHPSAPAAAALGFVDDEGDVCALLSNRDLREALAVSPALLRLRVGADAGADAGAAPAPAGCVLGAARGVKRAGAGKKDGASGAPGVPPGPLPLMKRVEGKAVGDAYGTALASFLEAARGSDSEGAFEKKTGIQACKMVKIFMSQQTAGGGDAAMVSEIPKDRVGSFCGQVSKHLVDSGASNIRRERLLAVIREALSDPGVRAGLVEVIRRGPARPTPADLAANQTPFQFFVESVTKPKSRVAINKARRAMTESDGSRKLLNGVRPAIRKAGMSFFREHCGKGPGVPLKNETAPSELGATIRTILSEAGADAAVVDAAEEFAVAMANDPGARLAGVRLLKKFRQQRVANKAGKADAEDVVCDEDASIADAPATAAGGDVEMAAVGIATTSIDEK